MAIRLIFGSLFLFLFSHCAVAPFTTDKTGTSLPAGRNYLDLGLSPMPYVNYTRGMWWYQGRWWTKRGNIQKYEEECLEPCHSLSFSLKPPPYGQTRFWLWSKFRALATL